MHVPKKDHVTMSTAALISMPLGAPGADAEHVGDLVTNQPAEHRGLCCFLHSTELVGAK